MSSVAVSLTYWDVADGEEADARVAVHRPLLRLTVGLTAVVHEAGVVPFGPRVDDAVLEQGRGQQLEFQYASLIVTCPHVWYCFL